MFNYGIIEGSAKNGKISKKFLYKESFFFLFFTDGLLLFTCMNLMIGMNMRNEITHHFVTNVQPENTVENSLLSR